MNEVEFYRRYRPKLFKHVVGQEKVVNYLQEKLKTKTLPHVILLTGPSGVGKTTLAHIIKSKLGCEDFDFCKVNSADFRGIDMVREIYQKAPLAAIGKTNCRMWLIDECHKMSNDAQNAILNILEDTPKHIYFILCTTDEGKLINAIRTRCTELKLTSLPIKDMQRVVSNVLTEEKKKLDPDVMDRLIEISEGSPRKALVDLGKIIDLSEASEQLATLDQLDPKKKGFDLARALMDKRSKWANISSIIKSLDTYEEMEKIRHIVLGYASSVLLGKGDHNRAFLIITCFKDHWYDSKRAGLISSCWEVMTTE